MSSWTPPQVEVLGIQRVDDTTVVEVHLVSDPQPPRAPATLNFEDRRHDVLVNLDGANADFRTNETLLDEIVHASEGLQQCWTPEAYAAVTNALRAWIYETPSTDHEHCLLDWTNIGTGGATAGWCSDGEWICDDCCDEYLVSDRLKLRT